MKFLVIGSTGLLGQAVTSEAQARRYEVVTAARSGAQLTLDIASESDLTEALNSVEADVIFNCAGLTSINDCEEDPCLAYKLNGRAVALLSEWCRSHSRGLIDVSTDHFFVGAGPRRHSEQDPVTLVNEYARTKYAGERFALTAPRALVLRTNIVGIRGWKRATFAEWAIACIQAGQPMTLFEDAFVSALDVHSFARAALDLFERGASGLLNVGSTDVFTKADLIRALADELNTKISAARAGSIRELSPARGDSLGLDVTAAERQLGYRLPNLQSVAHAVVAQYRNASRA